MNNEYSQSRLHQWASALQRERNSLGDSLIEYAMAWAAEVERLRAEIEQLRVERNGNDTTHNTL